MSLIFFPIIKYIKAAIKALELKHIELESN